MDSAAQGWAMQLDDHSLAAHIADERKQRSSIDKKGEQP
jgi:hypothetical protein